MLLAVWIAIEEAEEWATLARSLSGRALNWKACVHFAFVRNIVAVAVAEVICVEIAEIGLSVLIAVLGGACQNLDTVGNAVEIAVVLHT